MPGTVITLGLKYRDAVSGWEGTATARYLYLNGCERVQLDAQDKDGKPEGFVFDVQQLELVDAAPVVVLEDKKRAVGGPRSSAPLARP